MSSNRRTSPSCTDLWLRLARHRDRELCESDWHRILGAGFAQLYGFFDVLPGTQAETYPDPESGLPLVPRRVHDGTYTARPDDPEVTCVPAVTGLTPVQVARWRLSWDKIEGCVAGALGIEAHSGPGPFETHWVRSVGVLRGVDSTWSALLVMATSSAEALVWVRHLLRGEPRVFILPFHDEVCCNLVTVHGHRYVALDRDTRFVKSGQRWELKGAVARLATGDLGSVTKTGGDAKPDGVLRQLRGWNEVELMGETISLRKREKAKDFLRSLWDGDAKRHSTAIPADKQFGKPSTLFLPGKKYVRDRPGPTGRHVVVTSDRGGLIHRVYREGVGIVKPAKKGKGAVTKYYLRVFRNSDTT